MPTPTADEIIARRRAERGVRRAADVPEIPPLSLTDRLLQFGRGLGDSAVQGLQDARQFFGPGDREAQIAQEVGAAQGRPTRFSPVAPDVYQPLPVNLEAAARNQALARPSADALTFEQVLQRRAANQR